MPRSAQHDDAGSGSQRPRVRPQEGYSGRSREPLPTRVDDLPDLPSGYALALGEGLSDLGLALEPATRVAIDAHVRLLLAWNQSINLTAVRDPAEVARLHVLDSLAALPLLHERRADRFVDLGSGGGFPGLPLAVALPAERALLVESVGKKARFLEAATAAAGAGQRIGVAATRAETLAADPGERERWPIVTARAVASLAELVELSFPLLAPGGALIAWKRGDLEAELASADRTARALGGGRTAVRDAQVPGLPGHRLVVVEKEGRTPAVYPRDPAERRRRPW